MPTLNEANVRHLLRRTECVDRPARVAELLAMGSIQDAVDDVMDVPATPPSVSFSGAAADDNWRQGVELSVHWLDQMATRSRPFGERMAFFWHGHICSELGKVDNGVAMREQIDLYRRRGLGPAANGGNISTLVTTMSTQIAMLRYLDNDQNFADSPNQNFARELMELFLLGVGNYTEADVEAATAAWTGHTAEWPDGAYQFVSSVHEPAPQSFLGRTINGPGRPAREAGEETIEVILGTGPLGAGTIPSGTGPNAGRSSAEVAADFLSKKLWQEFGEAASNTVPGGVAVAMRSALIDNDFDIRPWVSAMLTHDDFYAEATRVGLVRQPVDFLIALMAATGLDAEQAGHFWLMERAGQRLLYPPNVSGWKPNGYWVNASSMGARQRIVQGCVWKLEGPNWADAETGYMDLPGGRLQRSWLRTPERSNAEVVDEFLRLTGMTDHAGDTGTANAPISAGTRQKIIAHLDDPAIASWQRVDALLLILSAPEMHIA